ncbi:MAG: TetR family transcriptional regulator [Alphaproteobacteria bacterium]|nr:TetR family transcriptional regulator [Alphaproteobacteria bacterium]
MANVISNAPGKQATKSAAMRRRICEAAVARLAAEGYHRTSIAKVVAASGVSTGALQHHFPTKLDLTAAVAEFLLARSVRYFARINAETEGAGLGQALQRSWIDQFKTTDYEALLQILVAARTDPDLKARVAPALEGWRAAMERELAALHPEGATRREVETTLTISRAMMTGLLVHDDLIGDDRRVAHVLDAWRRIAAP